MHFITFRKLRKRDRYAVCFPCNPAYAHTHSLTGGTDNTQTYVTYCNIFQQFSCDIVIIRWRSITCFDWFTMSHGPWRSVPDVMVTTLYHEMQFSKKSSPILSPNIILLNCWTWTRTNWSKNEITIWIKFCCGSCRNSLKFSINAWKDGFVTAQSTAQWSVAVQNG